MRFAISIFVAVRMFGCVSVDRDRIQARDFAAAIPAFAALDPSLTIAPSPIPGVARTFLSAEISKIAQHHNLELQAAPEEMCFERATETLTREMLLTVLRDALALPGARIEILDFSRAGVPHGTLSFSKSGLSAAGLWRGRMIFDQSKSTPVWVRVRVSIDRTWVETTTEIQSGKLIDASQLVLRTGPRFPLGPSPIASIDLAANQKALRAIRPGEPIFSSMLTRPREVETGDAVHVNVSSGGAILEFDAIAQSSAHAGESVLVKNPENNRIFQARVDGKGKVSIVK